MSFPVVRFTDERLANGLRLIIAEDHLAPVVAVNVWYGVGSKHEVPGKTGFAHLFEHVMFQGSRNVGKAEHIALVQAAGGTMNGTTWLDRTNYFETMPSHQLELALWLEADRMGTLLDALSQENLDNQREVVKNEKRWSYDNRPVRELVREAPGPPLPAGASLPPPDDRLDGGPRRRVGRGRVGLLPDLLRARTTPSCRSSATSIRRAARAWTERYFERIPANPSIPPLGDTSLPPIARRGAPRGRRGPGPAAPDLLRLPGAGRSATSDSTRSTWRPRSSPAARAAGSTGGSSATSGSPRTSSGSASGSSAARRSGPAGRRSGRASRSSGSSGRSSRSSTGSAASRSRDDELARAHALIETEELGALQRVEERADRLSMYATLFDDPDLINRMLGRYLSVTPERIRAVAAEVFRADNRVVMTYLPALPPAEEAPGPLDRALPDRRRDADRADEEAAA